MSGKSLQRDTAVRDTHAAADNVDDAQRIDSSSPLAISTKVLLFSAGYLCFWRGESLMKLACSAAHPSGLRGPDRGRERGRNQKGMAASRVMTPAMR